MRGANVRGQTLGGGNNVGGGGGDQCWWGGGTLRGQTFGGTLGRELNRCEGGCGSDEVREGGGWDGVSGWGE